MKAPYAGNERFKAILKRRDNIIKTHQSRARRRCGMAEKIITILEPDEITDFLKELAAALRR